MSGGGGKGGSQTSTTEIPAWVQGPAERNLARAEEISQIGYTPYMGPDVAAFTPAQQAAFANNNSAAEAFGMQGGAPAMPEATTYAGGVQGYSSYPMYQEAVDQLAATRPGQYAAIMDQFIDPVTGALPMSQPAQTTRGGALGGIGQNGFFDDQSQAAWEAANRGDGGSFNGGGFGGIGGYSGIGDMFDGGGPGVSGGAFQGAGRYSDMANAVTGRGDNSSGGGNK